MNEQGNTNTERVIILNTKAKDFEIMHKDICMLMADGDSTIIFTTNMEQVKISCRLCDMLARLDDNRYCRCHLSYAVNYDQINYVEKNKAGTKKKCIVMKNGLKAEIAYGLRKIFKTSHTAYMEKRSEQ